MDWNREDEIRKRAIRIWEAAGKPEGQDAAHWAQAERELGIELDLARNPLGNGQGDAQADDPKNEMHSADGASARRK